MSTLEPRLVQPATFLTDLGGKSKSERARATGEQFEAVFLNTVFQQMFTGIGKDGPLGDSTGAGAWRSFLTDEYAKSFAKAGGIGIGDQVYRALLAQQEIGS